MQTTTPPAPTPHVPSASPAPKRIGYAIAVVVNAALLVVVLNLQSWDLLPFLTDEFAGVVPWLTLSLVVSILANFTYQLDDSAPVHNLGDLLTSTVGVSAALRLLSVFPFDFAGSGFDASTLIRILLIVSIVGGGIGAVVALVRLIAGRT